ncbi:hypothetical protein [Polyangium aurulentum]|uniref:hypothetical protein n=1 Tax=Polyangium aurulentum TaxID=2567896 RepID=UPI0010AEBA82|nr:hypothetical protein [Polyangium aurulentum]UQA62086.1 hypothetical protein E8A73_017055 [Polyangium aurulentum]
MAKSKTGIEQSPLPETTAWARAVALAGGLFGVSLSERTLALRSVEELGRKIGDAVRVALPSSKALVDVLDARLRELGIDADCDRMRTARSARDLCEVLHGKSGRDVVDALAAARLDTSSSAVQQSLVDAGEALETLEDPLVLGVLRQLLSRERADLSSSKYLREAREILKGDEMRRALGVELRMVAGAAQAYLLSGAPSVGSAAVEAENTMPRSTVMASVIAPAQVRIESTRSAAKTPSPKTRPSPKSRPAKSSRTALSKTLVSEGVTAPNRVGVDRRGTVPDRNAARELLAEAVKEAEGKLEGSKGPVLFTVVVTVEVAS